MLRVKLDKCSKVLRVLLTFSMKSKSLQKGTKYFKISNFVNLFET